MFDEQPDGDPHGECAAEIHRLQAALQFFLFDFGQFDSDEERLSEFRRLRKAARPLLTDKTTHGVEGRTK
jgi:hypothetical protein